MKKLLIFLSIICAGYIGTLAIKAADGSVIVAGGNTSLVKYYRCTLTQSGTAAPVAQVERNDLGGTVVFARTTGGTYTGTLTGAFVTNKTTLYFTSAETAPTPLSATRTSADVITLHVDGDGVLVGHTFQVIVDPTP